LFYCPQAGARRGTDPTRKRRMLLLSKAQELKAVTGADVRLLLTPIADCTGRVSIH